MGNWLCACAKAKDSNSDCSLAQEKSLTQEKSSTKEKKNKRKKKEKRDSRSRKNKASRKNSEPSAPKEKLSITTVESLTNTGSRSECLNEGSPSPVDLTVVGHALPIRQKPVTPEIKHGDSNATVIVVQPSATSEHSSEETFPGGRLKRPITGSESNPSLSSPARVEVSRSNSVREVFRQDEESHPVSSQPPRSEDNEVPAQSSQIHPLLEMLKIRLDMAANNMEINRLMANVERALDRTSRIRELGVRRILAARASRRVHASLEDDGVNGEESGANENDNDTDGEGVAVDADYTYADEEDTGTEGEESFADGEETGTDGEETEEDIDSDEGSETPPPLRPRICWQ